MYPSFAKNYITKQRFTKEDQEVYNHHIIENFIESVKEMNNAVLIPSKLKDLDTDRDKIQLQLDDDLYEYYSMINTVKRDLFEPHIQEDVNNSVFTPKRKISRALIQRKEENKPPKERKVSPPGAVNGHQNHNNNHIPVLPLLDNKSLMNGHNGHQNGSGKLSPVSSRVSSCSDLGSIGQESDQTADSLKGQNSAQLTDQFIHHLHSMYHILEHFTKAADYITEQYIEQVEGMAA